LTDSPQGNLPSHVPDQLQDLLLLRVLRIVVEGFSQLPQALIELGINQRPLYLSSALQAAVEQIGWR
jgi:hypothetical protein